MADTYSRAVRSRVMSKVKSSNTSPEIALRRELWKRGVRGWRCNSAAVIGKPDISFRPKRLAVFVDGAFWHGHPSKYWTGRSGRYWDDKIRRNMLRDKRVNRELRKHGWSVIRIWDFQIERDLSVVASHVIKALHKNR